MKISAEGSGMEGTAVLELNASEHPIKAVTVFSSKKAEIVRSFSVELEVRRFYYTTLNINDRVHKLTYPTGRPKRNRNHYPSLMHRH